MGWWSDRVVPRIADKALDTAEVREMRPRVCAGLRGDVAEVGFGSGLNVMPYPERCVCAASSTPPVQVLTGSPRLARSNVGQLG